MKKLENKALAITSRVVEYSDLWLRQNLSGRISEVFVGIVIGMMLLAWGPLVVQASTILTWILSHKIFITILGGIGYCTYKYYIHKLELIRILTKENGLYWIDDDYCECDDKSCNDYWLLFNSELSICDLHVYIDCNRSAKDRLRKNEENRLSKVQ